MGKYPLLTIKKGISNYPETTKAVEHVSNQISHPNAVITGLFSSSYYDHTILGAEIPRLFPGPIIACSTSGEINQNGYSRHSMSGFSIVSDLLKVKIFPIYPISELDDMYINRLVLDIRLFIKQSSTKFKHNFGVLIIDGLSIMEEQLTAILGNALPEIPIVGGSSGDDLRLERSLVFINNQFKQNSAVFCLFSTDLPFETVQSQHYIPTDKRVVITHATPEKRIVQEINGVPAALEYARIIGVPKEHLCVDIFSKFPLLMSINGQYHVRGIQKINSDDSITFFSAITEGLVLRIGKNGDLARELEKSFLDVQNKIGPILLTIGFDCIHRRLESYSMGLDPIINKLFKTFNVVGFCTYGEQINGIHVNQTFAGISIGSL